MTPSWSSGSGVTTCESKASRWSTSVASTICGPRSWTSLQRADRRLGVLVDHLVPGSKETRIAEQMSGRANVLVVGHPYVDVWQSVKPDRLGFDVWPVIPRGTDWKHGICEAFGWPHADQADIARAWKRILGAVNSYADLEPSFLGRVEELIDFVTVG